MELNTGDDSLSSSKLLGEKEAQKINRIIYGVLPKSCRQKAARLAAVTWAFCALTYSLDKEKISEEFWSTILLKQT